MTINWADDIPLIQQITDVTSTNNEHQSPTNSKPTLLERFSNAHFEHHQAIPEVLTAIMKKELEIENNQLRQKQTKTTIQSRQNDIQSINSWDDQYRAQHMKNKTCNKVSSAIIRKRKEAAALAFTVPSAAHAFCFKSFPTRERKPVSEQRKNLKILVINNSRILDIHYPDTNVVGFPIYNDYEHEVI
ncbi:hypothetical protein BDA99DRAFT_608712 [Phascolomyces articulosus]|uniref:Uncharacterized protein n=1 Tax=Phascolomyces articulosus TaxID=60185 RepID=A0AAD5P956_9FUNG|nr:hypothetical protein BDA99DRAFT_608712 [Phascolomyces articulosus]